MRNSHSATLEKKTSTQNRSDFLVDGDNVELVVLESASSSFLNARTTSLKTRVRGCFTHHCTDHYRSTNCAGAISASSKSMKTNSTILSSVTSWMRKMADDVLRPSFLPNLGSATPSTLAVKDQCCFVSVSFHFTGIEKELLVLFSPFVDSLFFFRFPVPWSLR